MTALSQIRQSAKSQEALADVSIAGEFLRYHDFTDAWLGRLVANDADLQGTCWRAAVLDEPHFDDANLYGSTWDDARVLEGTFHGAKLARSQLHRTTLFSCAVMDADLSFVDATGADFDSTVFQRCSFTNAKLTGVVAKYASFRGCDMTNADLSGMQLEKTSFEGAILRGVCWNGVVMVDVAFDPGADPRVTR
ncbi:MAG: pentapeptide repeat-containing protein [Candidatus Nanopelagicales bacterium]